MQNFQSVCRTELSSHSHRSAEFVSHCVAAVMDQAKERFKYVQMYRADFNESLPGHPRWTLYSKGNTPPPNPPPTPPSPPGPKPSVAYCATKALAYNFSRALLAGASKSLTHVADDVFDALQLGAQCNQSRAEIEQMLTPALPETHSTTKRSVRAATRIVDCQNGDDTVNDGLTSSSPLRSISQALRSLATRGPSAPPGLIRIRAGTCYLEVGALMSVLIG